MILPKEILMDGEVMEKSITNNLDQETNDNKDLETYDINDVEIFSTGKWTGKGSADGGDVIDDKYLQDIVDSYNSVGTQVKPRMILSHDGDKSKQLTGMPAVGWLKNLRTAKGKLYADIKNIPKKIKKLIDVKAYGRFSPGIWTSMDVNGVGYKNVLDHLALLGAQIPANTDIDGLIDLYEIDNNNDMKIYNRKETIMDESKIKEFEKTIEDQSNSIKEYEKNIQAMKEENDKIRSEMQRKEYESKEKEVKSYLEKKADEGVLLPAQMSMYVALCLGSGVKEYSYIENNEKKTIAGDGFELVKAILENSPQVVEFENKSVNVEIEKKVDKPDGDILDEKIKQYMKDNSVEYIDAYEHYAYGGE